MTNQSFDYEKVDQLLKNAKSIEDITGKNGFLQEMFKGTIERLLKAEMEDHLGYAENDRSSKRTKNSRNGYSKKTLKTSGGQVEVDVPRDRDGDFEPQIIKKHQTRSNDLEQKIISMYAKGMTTRDISSHLADLYGTEVSPTLISNVTGKVLEMAKEWQSRPLDSCYPCLFLDAIHFKVKKNSRVESKAAYVCLGLKTSGIREILGVYIGDTESSKFWLSVLTDLQNRGVEDILIACIDGLKGFPEAIEAIFPKTEIQLCIVHQIRNSLRYVGSKHQRAFLADLKTVYQATTQELAEANLNELEQRWGSQYPVVINSWKSKWLHLSSYFKYTGPIRKMIYTTNVIEGYHRQLRKVTKNRSIFPSDDSLFKLIYLASLDASKKWTMPRQGWAQTVSQLSIHFEGRLQIDL